MRERSRHLWVLGFSAVVSWWVASPGFGGIRTRIVGDNGDAMWQLSIVRWTLDALWSYDLPWDSPMFFPTTGTYAYSDPMLTQALLAAPFRAVGAGPALVSNVVVLLTWTASMYIAWRLLRRIIGSDPVALAGATAWACSELRIGTIVLFQLVTAAFLLPLAFERLLAVLDRPNLRRGGELGLVIAAAVLAALYYGPLLAVTVPIATIAWFLAARRRPTRAHVAALALAALVAVAPVAPLVLRYRDIHDRDHLQRAAEAVFSADVDNLIDVAGSHPALVSLPVLERADNAEHALFPGLFVVVALPIGIVGLLLRRRASEAPAWDVPALVAVAAAGVAAYALAAGTNGPVLAVLDGIPGFDGIRAPVRFAVLGHLGLLAGVSAMVVATLRHARRSWVLAVSAVLVATTLVGLRPWRQTADVPDERRWTAVNERLATLPEGPVLELPILQGADGAAHPRVEAPRLYLARIDGNKRVNGYSGYQPPGFDRRAAIYNTFPAAEAVDALRSAEVRYVVLRTSVVGWRVRTPSEYRAVYGLLPVSRLRISPSRLAEVRGALPPSVREAGTYGDAVLFEVLA